MRSLDLYRAKFAVVSESGCESGLSVGLKNGCARERLQATYMLVEVTRQRVGLIAELAADARQRTRPRRAREARASR